MRGLCALAPLAFASGPYDGSKAETQRINDRYEALSKSLHGMGEQISSEMNEFRAKVGTIEARPSSFVETGVYDGSKAETQRINDRYEALSKSLHGMGEQISSEMNEFRAKVGTIEARPSSFVETGVYDGSKAAPDSRDLDFDLGLSPSEANDMLDSVPESTGLDGLRRQAKAERKRDPNWIEHQIQDLSSQVENLRNNVPDKRVLAALRASGNKADAQADLEAELSNLEKIRDEASGAGSLLEAPGAQGREAAKVGALGGQWTDKVYAAEQEADRFMAHENKALEAESAFFRRAQGQVKTSTNVPAGEVDAKAKKACLAAFWDNWDKNLRRYDDGRVFVSTGDIPAMWIRDSAAQMAPYVAHLPPQGPLRARVEETIEGVLRTQARYIVADPYANGYREAYSWQDGDATQNAGGWVGFGTFEIDSGAWFLHFAGQYLDQVPQSGIAKDQDVMRAVETLMRVYKLEQHHEKSQYRHPSLSNGGKGAPVEYTGMVWTGFRPSDDASRFNYLIPANLFLAKALDVVPRLVGKADVQAAAKQLKADILQGVKDYGTRDVYVHGHGRRAMYCYEVDGRGNCNKEDDANLPSLLGLPYLDKEGTYFDKDIYEQTRAFVTSPSRNKWYFEGNADWDGDTVLHGEGSRHTGPGYVWPMAMIVEALTNETSDKTPLVHTLVKATNLERTKDDPEGYLVHESMEVDMPQDMTRASFGWANALYAELLVSQQYCAPEWAEERVARTPLKAPTWDHQGQQVSFMTAPPEALYRKAPSGLDEKQERQYEWTLAATHEGVSREGFVELVNFGRLEVPPLQAAHAAKPVAAPGADPDSDPDSGDIIDSLPDPDSDSLPDLRVED